MGESEYHARLVGLIANWVRKAHGTHGGLSLLIDSRELAPERRPGRIGGFTPDVVARTVPSSFVLIGEAKSYADFFTPHTSHQIAAFIEYLRPQADPFLVIATPLAVLGAAKSLVWRLRRDQCATGIGLVFLYG